MRETKVSSASVHPFESQHGSHLFVINGSRVYDLDSVLEAEVNAAVAKGDNAVEDLLARYGLGGAPYVDDAPLESPPIRALSLAVAQACNLGCGYCYAQGGTFGGRAKTMDWLVARDAVLRLLMAATPGDRVNLSFLGGEPLSNRALIQKTTRFALAEARAKDIRIGFSITTNGTLIESRDCDFFEEHGFSVTVSLDGVGATHDRLRPFRGGLGSYQRVLARLTPLLECQQRMQVSARVTVTPLNLELRETLDEFVRLGFHSVGFSPVLSSPTGMLELDQGDMATMLEQMILCGHKFEAETASGRRYPFSNLAEALRQIHRGTHRPYPCGAGAGYFGVSAEGGLFACHRFVENDEGSLGHVAHGIDRDKRNSWLAQRHVHRQEPCKSCWARYLCGGGCHHEVISRGRPACDFIRGWLHYCLEAYVNTMERCPTFFSS
jgi:uncharacterized protein